MSMLRRSDSDESIGSNSSLGSIGAALTRTLVDEPTRLWNRLAGSPFLTSTALPALSTDSHMDLSEDAEDAVLIGPTIQGAVAPLSMPLLQTQGLAVVLFDMFEETSDVLVHDGATFENVAPTRPDVVFCDSISYFGVLATEPRVDRFDLLQNGRLLAVIEAHSVGESISKIVVVKRTTKRLNGEEDANVVVLQPPTLHAEKLNRLVEALRARSEEALYAPVGEVVVGNWLHTAQVAVREGAELHAEVGERVWRATLAHLKQISDLACEGMRLHLRNEVERAREPQ